MSETEDSSHASGAIQQAPGLWRTDLQRQDLSGPGREVVQSRVQAERIDLSQHAVQRRRVQPADQPESCPIRW